MGERIEKAVPNLFGYLANVLDDAAGSVGALSDFFGVGCPSALEIRVADLKLADFVEVSRRDAAAGAAARLFGDHVYAVPFPSEIEQAMRYVRHHATLVDGQALGHAVALVVDGHEFPAELARIRDDSRSDCQRLDGLVDDARREEIELQATRRVPGIGTAVYLEHDLHGSFHAGTVAEFFDDLGDQASFAFVSHADAAVGDEFAFVVGEGHVGRGFVWLGVGAKAARKWRGSPVSSSKTCGKFPKLPARASPAAVPRTTGIPRCCKRIS